MAQILRSIQPDAYTYNSPVTFNLVANVVFTITIPTSTNIMDVSLYTAAGEDIADGLHITVTATQVSFTSNVNINTLTAKVVFEK